MHPFVMGAGIEYFMALDVFSLSWVAILNMALFFYIFTYLNLRGVKEKPGEMALEITGYVLVVALLLAFTSIPSFWAGVIIIIAFTIIFSKVTKISFREYLTGLIPLFVMIMLFAFLDDVLRLVLSAFALIYIGIVSEINIRRKKAGAKAK